MNLRAVVQGSLMVVAMAGACSAQFNPPSLPYGSVGTPYSVTIMPSEGNCSCTWSISQGSLPPGLSGNQITIAGVGTEFQISGTPTAGGTYSFTVRSTAPSSNLPIVTTEQYSIGVPQITTPSPLVNGFTGQVYNVNFNVTDAPGPFAITLTSGQLPPGLNINGQSLTGTPTTAGTYSFTITAQSTAVQASALKNFTVTILQSATIDNPSPLPNGVVGQPYSITITASGGTKPYQFGSQFTLPPGLTLSQTGLLSGTPSTAGSYTLRLSVLDANGITSVKDFALTVTAAAINVTASSLTFTAQTGGDPTSPQSVGVFSSGAQPFTVLVDDGNGGPAPAWLSVQRSGITPARLSFIADPGNMPPATYTARARVTAGSGAPLDIAITFIVQAAKPQLQVLPSFLRFVALAAAPATLEQVIVVSNRGGLSYQASILHNSPWITLALAGDQTVRGKPSFIRVIVNTQNLGVGAVRDTVRILSPAGVFDVVVTVFVVGTGPVLRVPVSGLRLSAGQGHTQSVKASVRILNTGTPGSTVSWTADVQGGNFLTLSPSSGTATLLNPAKLTLTPNANADALAPGTYYVLVRVTDRSSANSPQYVAVVFSVLDPAGPATLDVSPPGLLFVSTPASPQPASQTFSVNTVSTAPVAFQAAGNAPSGTWVSASPAAGQTSSQAPGTVTVSVNVTGLKPGVYVGEVDVAEGGLLRGVTVVLIVIGPSSSAASEERTRAAAGCTPTQTVITPTGVPLGFSTPAGWPLTIAVTLTDDCGAPIPGFKGAVTARFDNGDSPLSLLDPQQDGTYTADWTPLFQASPMNIHLSASAGALQASTMDLTGGVVANSQAPPVLFENGTVNNTNPSGGALMAPGTVSAVYGQNLASSTVSPGVVPLLTSFNGTTVNFGGIAAPLFFLSNGQLNIQVPAELAPNQTYAVAALVNNAYSALPNGVTLVAATPGVAGFPDGTIIAQHADFTLIDANHPAKPGETIILYLTGMGASNPSVASGQPSPAVPAAATVVIAPTVTVDSKPANFVFAGLTPFGVGLYQINLTIPSDARTGNLDVVVSQNGQLSNTTQVPVKP